MGDALTIEDVLMEAGYIPKWIAEGKEEVARNLLKRRWSIEETAEIAELDIEKVRILAKNIQLD
ncbi:MAG: hypothetical protein LBC60_03285 [Spirochaetaceae bacterium]|nr:hypothetical protein [Spirochaetaceae bacterium]